MYLIYTHVIKNIKNTPIYVLKLLTFIIFVFIIVNTKPTNSSYIRFMYATR
jgi:uncharacterized integral membrane protein